MPRGKARKQPSSIPWGKCATEEGTALAEAIQSLDVEKVKKALQAFTTDPSLIDECKLYKTFTRSKEEEDAHDEALPPLCVLIEAECKSETKDESEASSAVEVVHEIAKALLAAGADPATRGNYISAPMMAVEVGAIETARVMVEHLKQQGKQLTGGSGVVGKTRQNGMYGGHGSDCFYAAAKSSKPEMLPMLYNMLKDELGEESSNGYKTSLGRLLDVACIFKRTQNVVFLLEKGASPEGVHFDKKTDWCDWQRPLHSACNQGNPEIVQALLDAGASIETRCVNGMPFVGGPIHFACGGTAGGDDNDKITTIEKRIETVRRLITAGCDVNQASVMERKTPLEHAIQAGACDMIRFLIVEALCDTEGGKDYERLARQHKKKAVARAFQRSMEEREGNNGEARPVKLRREEGAAPSEPDMIDFPNSGGDPWTWDGEEDMFPSTVQFHPTLGLFNGEEHLQMLKALHGTSPSELSESLEEDENDEEQPESQQVMELAQELGVAMKDETLRSETDASWNPFWMLSTPSGDGGDRKPAARRSRRSRRGGPPLDETVKPLFLKLLGEEREEKLTIQTLEVSELGDALEVGKRSPAMKSFVKAMQGSGVDKAVSVVIKGAVIFPAFVGCLIGQENPCLAGVYAHKVET